MIMRFVRRLATPNTATTLEERPLQDVARIRGTDLQVELFDGRILRVEGNIEVYEEAIHHRSPDNLSH